MAEIKINSGYVFAIVLFAAVVFSGCGSPSAEKTSDPEKSGAGEQAAPLAGVPNQCKKEKVAIEGYGDKGQRLESCFVEYPGEPSRQDKSYYVVEDVCGQFTQAFMENMLGRKLTKIEPSKTPGVNACDYYVSDKDWFTVNLEYLSVENQKKGNEFIGHRTEKGSQIPMDNLVTWEKDDLINVVYLVFNPNKFLSIRPVSKQTFASPEEFLAFTAKIGSQIKSYK